MSFLRSRFVQAVLVLVIAFVVLRFGIRPPAPWSVLTLYMSIVLLAVLVFVSSDSDSWREFVRPIRATLVSPDRKDQASFKKHVAAGAEIYIRNCVYCHGDNLDGKGHFAYGFNPPPANFQDPGTIAMLQEAYLFWRIAKGGPGLPKESTPWNSVMPAWEDRLTEEQIWEAIIYLYDATGQHPRRWEESH